MSRIKIKKRNMEQIKSFLDKLQNEITDVQDLEALKQIKAKYLSKSVFLIELKSKIREASQEEKQEIGNQINLYSKGVQEILNDRKDHIENNFTFDEVENPFLNDETMELPKSAGSLHPFTILSNEIQQFFNKNGYVYSHGIEVEEEKYNFDILNMPADHPARAMQDTFYLDNGKLLRTHCTNTTARALEQTTSDTFKHYTIGTVFRNDDNDATHSFQFNQIDIFSLSKNTSIANLK
ncbi:MAG: hypothetical protein DRP42_01955 [Tenericutes bacterium]|nr:MAG: hypothetical protein DRP42_01955 [Mycoplasmatota bacterium]